MQNTCGNQTLASKVIRLSNGKCCLEVGGKPFLMGHVQNCGGQQLLGNFAQEPYKEQLPISWLENCFEKTSALGYRTISIIFKWSEIEPMMQGQYDWTLIDHYVDWAVKYDLFLDIAWFGSNACGGARLKGYGRGWASWIPLYLNDKEKYFGNGTNRYEADSEVFCPWLPDGGQHSADAEFLFACEKAAVRELFDHLRVKDTGHRTILFQVFNEPNCHSEWFSKKQIWLYLINELGKAVKMSDYIVATRVNLGKDIIDSDIGDLEYIDIVGCDPYMCNISGIREALHSGRSVIPHISENAASLRNTSSLVVTALMFGGYYNPWQLNDHWEDIGMYQKSDETYMKWTLGIIPQMRESGTDMANLNTAINKIASIIASVPVGRIVGFNVETDNPDDHYKKVLLIAEGIEIGFSCDNASVGMVVNNEKYVYLVSDTSKFVIFALYSKPKSVSIGKLDSNENWIEEKNPEMLDNNDGSYNLKCNSRECIRVEL